MLDKMNFGSGNSGKLLVIAGVFLCLVGLLAMVLEKMGLFRLPGDLTFNGKNWHVFIPITSCLLISILLTLLFWLISHFSK